MVSWKTLGHKNVKQLLERDLQKRSLAQTYLLIGPSGTGKLDLLREFANEIYGGGVDVDNHIDSFVFERGGNPLGIKEFRELKVHLNLSPQKDFKIVLIEDIERLSVPLQNAMLKILEEPPSYVYFLLTSSGLDNVLDTIISRARVLRSGGASGSELQGVFEEGKRDGMEYLQVFSMNRMKRMEFLKENREVYEELVSFWEELERLYAEFIRSRGNVSAFKLMKMAEEMAEDKEKLLMKLEIKVVFWQKKMLESSGKKRLWCAKNVLKCMDSMIKLEQNINSRLVLEVLFLHCFGKVSSIESQTGV